MENMEEQHKVMIKVYMQKVKHLEYEHGQSQENVKSTSRNSMTEEEKVNKETEDDMKKDKDEKKIQYGDNDNANLSEIESVEEDLKGKLTEVDEVLNASKKELISNYERKLAKLKKELDLRLKVEIHEIEERKNQHYNDLMKNHEKAFRDMKDYYNDITRENLDLIKANKESLAQVNNNIIINQTEIDTLKITNGELQEPLMKAKNQRKTLKKQLATYEKDQMSLRNAKAQYIVLKKKVEDFTSKKKELDQKMEKIDREKADMYAKFEVACDQLRSKAEYKNTKLDEKLSELEEDHQRKETQLHELIQRSVIDPKTVDEI
mmetsp:Transcript_2169/g.2046  ORF Transcript_2169/g.2046 Transcript_2169/m.2046 type:complete len:320 (+) Transcript_2169:261-1220(+)